MGRGPCCDKEGLKRGPWALDEDQLLTSYVQKHGHGNWHVLPKQAGLLRCGKSCRLRWLNYLRPDLKRGNFTREEEETIIKLHEIHGNRWSTIAAKLPGRTDNEIKNVWHTNLKKKLSISKKLSSGMPESCFNESNLSPGRSSSELSSVTDQSAKGVLQIDESFWSEQCPKEMSSSGIESTTMTRSSNEQLIIQHKEMESSKFMIRSNKGGSQDHQVSLLDESRKLLKVEGVISEPKFEFPSSRIDCGNELSAKMGDDMEFWFNVFTRAEDLPDLPDF